ncbi:MAG: tripartite tricarboxylate transporter TctB family protein [Alphaproteobacteria bacterium]
MMTRKHAEWLVVLFFVGVVAVVFQQIHTSMAEQGIASGSPYDNAAAFPRAVAILIGMLVVALLVSRRLIGRPADGAVGFSFTELRRPVLLLVVFGVYLATLKILGYHLATPAMIMAVMVLCGVRKPIELALVGVGISLVLAFFFEGFLNIVLPGGLFRLNISWPI